MSILDDFKNFISNGNVLDLTVGVITGAAFSKVVSSFTDDILMPAIGLLKGVTGVQNLPALPAALPHPTAIADSTQAGVAALSAAPAVSTAVPVATGLDAFGFGNFVNALVYFVIISFVILMVTKVANRFRKPTEVEVVSDPATQPVLSREEALLIEIRDALLRNRGE